MARATHHSNFVIRLVIFGVAVNGVILIAGSLLDQFLLHFRFHVHINSASVGFSLLAGLTLLYFSSLLARRKQTAWAVTLAVYTFLLVLNVIQLTTVEPDHTFAFSHFIRNLVFPLVIAGALLYYRNEFKAKSDLQSFRQSLPIIIIIVGVTFMYGTAGFLLMDDHDFHQEIGVTTAMHRTVDQFGLTTDSALTPRTQRARIFIDSLSVISIGALIYILVSLFQPLKARFIDQSYDRELIRKLLENHPADSEDFFKLWPHDKLYYINTQRTAAIA